MRSVIYKLAGAVDSLIHLMGCIIIMLVFFGAPLVCVYIAFHFLYKFW